MTNKKDLQMMLTDILNAKGKELKNVKPQDLHRWSYGISSILLSKVDEICEDNDIDVLLFNGNIETLIAFNKKIGEKMGFKTVITFEI